MDLAGAAREGLLGLAVGTGLETLQVLLDESVTALAGPKGKHNPGRAAVRHGGEAGRVTSGGRRAPSAGRGSAAPSAEAAVPAYGAQGPGCPGARASVSGARDPKR